MTLLPQLVLLPLKVVRDSSRKLSWPSFMTPIGRWGVRLSWRLSQDPGSRRELRVTIALTVAASQIHVLNEKGMRDVS